VTLLPALAGSLGHVVWRAAARVTGALDATLPLGVDIHGYAVLTALADGAPRSQQWLADAVAVSRTTMTKVAAQLVEAGLVERDRNPVDRRAYALTRTPAGAEAVERWADHVAAVEDALVAGLTRSERVELHALLVAQVGQDLGEDTPAALLASTAFLVTRLHARLHVEVASALRELDVEPRHLGTFLVLHDRGPVAQSELARHLGVSGPSVVEIVDQLERRGALERRRSDTDRRTQLLHLLPPGEELLPVVHRRGAQAADRVLGRLSARERDRLRRLLVGFVTGGS
jgi:DNA-binding MarR family transcriptional regulator